VPRRNYVKPVPPQVSFQPQPAPALPTGDPDAAVNSLKRSDAIEFRPEVRQAYRKAWMAASAGQTRQEAEFSTAPGPNGKIVIRPTTVTDDDQMEGVGRVNAHVYPNDQIIFHTHSKYKEAKPSPTDIASAKSSGKPILTGSRDGLFETDPNTGKTEQIANGLDWTDPNKELPGEKDDPPNVGFAAGQRREKANSDATLGRHIVSKADPTVRVSQANPDVTLGRHVQTVIQEKK
jgi:hypothetical protein